MKKTIKRKKNFSVFFIPLDRDWGRPVIVASPKALGKAARGEACNYIVCAYKSSSSYAIIADLIYISAGGYDDIPSRYAWKAEKKCGPAACEESCVLGIFWKKSKHLCYNF